MREILRSARRTLLRCLSALLSFSSSAIRFLLERLRPGIVFLRSAARSLVRRLWAVVRRLPAVLERSRSISASLLHRLADRIAPKGTGREGGAGAEAEDYAEMLLELGAEPPPPGEGADALKDTTIRALSENLHGLRDLGDQLARTEQDRLTLAARVKELEAEVGGDARGEDAVVARLERKLEQRERLLASTREKLTRQRATADDWKTKAADRWDQIAFLRKQVKELERGLAEARDAAQPPALPKPLVSGSRQEPRAGGRSPRAG